MADLSFTPPIAIPKPSNLPSNICTISSGVGNFNIKKDSLSSPAECAIVFGGNYQRIPVIGGNFPTFTSNASGVNYRMVPNIGVQNYPHAPDHVTYSQYHNGSIFSVPKSWPTDRKEDLVITVYSLVKTLLG